MEYKVIYLDDQTMILHEEVFTSKAKAKYFHDCLPYSYKRYFKNK